MRPSPLPDPTAPKNGKTTCKMLRGLYVCQFSCNEGYYIQGVLTSACMLKDGTWSDPAPSCVGMCAVLNAVALSCNRVCCVSIILTTAPRAYWTRSKS